MKQNIEEKLANSLTAETTELLPFLPYLLQDFWELGIDPTLMIKLVDKYIHISKNTKVLDLACGKGVVSIKLADKLNIKTKGIDLIPAFIEYAKQKANEYNVDDLCEFIVGDINKAVENEKNYDCVIYGAVGDVLGNRVETLNKLKSTVKSGGFIILDNYDFINEAQWLSLFKETSLQLIETVSDSNQEDNNHNDTAQLITDGDLGMVALHKRANELIEKHPDKRSIFEAYIESQQKEYDYIEAQGELTNVTWILQK